MRAEHRALCLVEILADQAWNRTKWQSLVTQLIQEKAALFAANERLREELRRYTGEQVAPTLVDSFDSTDVPPPAPALDKRARARQIMQDRAAAERIF